jgi:hypothetical protein
MNCCEPGESFKINFKKTKISAGIPACCIADIPVGGRRSGKTLPSPSQVKTCDTAAIQQTGISALQCLPYDCWLSNEV